MVFDYIKDLKASYDLSRAEDGPCAEVVEERRKCERIHGLSSSGHEECIKEELAEKKCLASCLCHEEFLLFYGSLQGKSSVKSCAEIVEQFKNDPKGLYSDPEKPRVKIPARCRQASYQLGKCLHRHTKNATKR